MTRFICTALSLVFLAGCASRDKLGIELWTSPNRKISDDYILVSPSSANDENAFGPQDVFLTDMKGEIVKRWTVKRTASHSRLRADGTLVSLLLSRVDSRITTNGGECNELIGTDTRGQQVFSIPMTGLSHDFDMLDENRFAVFKFERIDQKEIRKFYPKSPMEFAFIDRVIVIDSSGKEQWTWSLRDHFKELRGIRLNPDNTTITNGNSIQFIKENPKTKGAAFLLNYRNLDVAILVSYPEGKILWQSPPRTLSRAHDASLNGERVVVFNNNLFGSEVPNLQIREWNVLDEKETFFWQPPSWAPITTSVMGGVRKLSNGSYLVSNSIAGNLIEVDAATRKMVWSYLVLPERKGTRIWSLGMAFYRAETYPAAEIKRMFGGNVERRI